MATIEMGARQYVPALGRFLEVDPVAGGNANDYNYPNDPVNGADITGRCSYTPDGSCSLRTSTAAESAAVRKWWQFQVDDFMTNYAPGIPTDGAIVGGIGAIGKAARVASVVRLTASEIRPVAGRIGATVVKGELAHGQQIFQLGKKFISYDVDGHKGGFWKVGTSVKNLQRDIRVGTYNRNMTKRIGK